MSDPISIQARVRSFCNLLGIQNPILLAPMAGACPPSLSIAVANAGGLGACGALLMQPDAIKNWAADVRGASNGGFQINLWIPGPPPVRDAAAEASVRAFLATWGPEVPPHAGDATPPDFTAQCDAILEAAPTAISSIMGVYPAGFVTQLKAKGILWLATATTATEAKLAEEAGADAIIAQGMEAGGHRGSFIPERAETTAAGLFALLPAICNAVALPVIAAGGIADARGVAAALVLGASAVQIGTGFLRSPEAKLPIAWADALGHAQPEDTLLTRAFSGRAGRSLATDYAVAAASGPNPAPYPIQRSLTQAMRDVAAKTNDLSRMQAWAGQSAHLARDQPAGETVTALWDGARSLLQFRII